MEDSAHIIVHYNEWRPVVECEREITRVILAEKYSYLKEAFRDRIRQGHSYKVIRRIPNNGLLILLSKAGWPVLAGTPHQAKEVGVVQKEQQRFMMGFQTGVQKSPAREARYEVLV